MASLTTRKVPASMPVFDIDTFQRIVSPGVSEPPLTSVRVLTTLGVMIGT